MHKFSIAIVGGGNMGGAFARALLKANIVTAKDLLLIEKNQDKCEVLSAALGTTILASIDTNISSASTVILAVKPQDAEATCIELAHYLKPEQLIISVMVGMSIQYLQRNLNAHTKIVRSMPNIAAQIGRSITVYVEHAGLSAHEKARTKELIDAMGSSIKVEDENMIDAAIALSATGPGYIYYLVEHTFKICQELGFNNEASKLLIGETVGGTMELWRQSSLSPTQLKSSVVSENGTTAAAFKVFEELGLKQIWHKGILRALERARELSKT